MRFIIALCAIIAILACCALPLDAARLQRLSSSSSVSVPSLHLQRELAALKEPKVAADAQSIIDELVKGSMRGLTYDRLANFTDTIGPRFCGSADLEKAVEFLVDRLNEEGFDNVRAEEVRVPYWHRGSESLVLLSPRKSTLNFLSLGYSVGTQQYGEEGLTAEVLVVQSFDELEEKKEQAKGKIVVFNEQCDWDANPIRCYGSGASYRVRGAQKAAAAGAVAMLVRSVASFSINSPHTGMMAGYGDGPQIPAAAITTEDADMFLRMQTRGQTILLNLKMEAYTQEELVSAHNVVAEIRGWEKPDEVVLVSGHLDSWDNTVGAMDDGGGMAISWSVLSVIKKLGLRPRRTLRFVAWACEEMGGLGAQQYFDQHAEEAPRMSLAMESDLGVFRPRGLEFTGSEDAFKILRTIGQLLTPIDAAQVTDGGEGTDIAPWMQAGVPGASLYNDNQKYFWFHHSAGDTMSVLNSDDVDKCAATWAVHAYSVANLLDMLPRD